MNGLRRIVANLLRIVPDPPKPIARPTKSFAGLKAGQLLVWTQDVKDGKQPIVWCVKATDSQGADMYHHSEELYDECRIESRDWKSAWTRVRAPRKRAAKEPA